MDTEPLRRAAIYFGLADYTDEEREVLPPPRPFGQVLLSLLIVSLLLGGAVAVIGQDMNAGLKPVFSGAFAVLGARIFLELRDRLRRSPR